MIQGSSVDPDVVAQVGRIASKFTKALVFLDSNHTHEHVLAELEAYAPFTGVGSYCCVFDTLVEDVPDEMFADRPWGKGDNPKTAVHAYRNLLETEGRTASDGRPLKLAFDNSVDDRLLITVAPQGYLKRVS